jgi:GTP-binding protein
VTDEPAPDDIELGRKLFAQPCDFVWGADNAGALPPMTLPEVAFAGRSNVGKSSLINALTGRKALARTSMTPGRTQQLNFFSLGGKLQLVDMPGYGYAAVGKEKVANWTKLAHDFLRGRASLLRVYVLIDARHGLKPLDHETMEAFDRSAVSFAVVLTKVDAVKAGAREAPSSCLSGRAAHVVRGRHRHPRDAGRDRATHAGTGIGALMATTAQCHTERTG